MGSVYREEQSCIFDKAKMPTSCCAVGCSNRHKKGSNLVFYKIPSGRTPFEAKRRSDWIKAIKRKDWETWDDDKISKERICGAHFLCCIIIYLFDTYLKRL